MKNLIRKYLKHLGMALVFAGVILLIVSHFTGWTSINAVLITSLSAVLAGAVLHVQIIKRGLFDDTEDMGDTEAGKE